MVSVTSFHLMNHNSLHFYRNSTYSILVLLGFPTSTQDLAVMLVEQHPAFPSMGWRDSTNSGGVWTAASASSSVAICVLGAR